MTKEEAIKVIRHMAYLSAHVVENGVEAYEYIEQFLSKPSLPSNLDEAANDYVFIHEYAPPTGNHPLADAFKAGAEWMAGQGISFDTEISWLDGFGFQIGWPEDTSIFDCFNPGDKVVVQIINK